MEKRKVLFDIIEIFKSLSDHEHGLSRKDIEALLETKNSSVERRTIYRYISEINKNGLLEIAYDGKKYYRIEPVSPKSVSKILRDLQKGKCSAEAYSTLQTMLLDGLSNYQKKEVEKKLTRRMAK